MVVAGLVLDPQSNAPIVILKDPAGEACLPIWIGLPEATAIASSLKKVQLARPMTHDLLKNTIDELGGSVIRVVISSLIENTFIATIELKVGDSLRVIDSRPSDAIALAVRVNCQIFVAAPVQAQANVTIIPLPAEGAEEVQVSTDQLVTEGQDQNFANIEKDKWEELLAEMDPDDFKYKM